MSLSYSRDRDTGIVDVREDGKLYADLTHATGSFEDRVERAKEIVEAVNAARGETLAERKERALREHGVSAGSYVALDGPSDQPERPDLEDLTASEDQTIDDMREASDTPAAFDVKVLRAREIVYCVNTDREPTVEQTEDAVREASERQRSETQEAGLS